MLPEGPFAGDTPGRVKVPGTEVFGVVREPPGCACAGDGDGA